jgi:nitrogen fixation NifU-like protein
MPGLEDLYQELILDHYRNRRGEGRLDDPTVEVDQNNPLCGDVVHLELKIQDGRIAEVGHTGEGCSISRASASMLAETLPGSTIEEAFDRIERFRQMMHGEEIEDEDLGDAIALSGVAKFPARIKCALLSWTATNEALLTYQSDARSNGDGH